MQVVAAVLQHYARLPEVMRTGGARFVPVYYWVRAVYGFKCITGSLQFKHTVHCAQTVFGYAHTFHY